MEAFDYARRIVDGEIARLYRQWGAAAAEVGREDLTQIGFLTLLSVVGQPQQQRIAVRHDFSDLLRSSSGIRRKHKAAIQRRLRRARDAHGYAPLEPMRGFEALTEVELAVHVERELEKLSRQSPRKMDCVQSVAQGEETAQIAKRLGVIRNTVWTHCTLFRRALAG